MFRGISETELRIHLPTSPRFHTPRLSGGLENREMEEEKKSVSQSAFLEVVAAVVSE